MIVQPHLKDGVYFVPISYSNEFEAVVSRKIVFDRVALLYAQEPGIIPANGLEMVRSIELDDCVVIRQEEIETKSISGFGIYKSGEGLLSGESYFMTGEPRNNFVFSMRYGSFGMCTVGTARSLIMIGGGLEERPMGVAYYFDWGVRSFVDHVAIVKSISMFLSGPCSESFKTLRSPSSQKAFFTSTTFFQMVVRENNKTSVLWTNDNYIVSLINIVNGIIVEEIVMEITSFGDKPFGVFLGAFAITGRAVLSTGVGVWCLSERAMYVADDSNLVGSPLENSFGVVIPISVLFLEIIKESGTANIEWNISHVSIYLRELI